MSHKNGLLVREKSMIDIWLANLDRLITGTQEWSFLKQTPSSVIKISKNRTNDPLSLARSDPGRSRKGRTAQIRIYSVEKKTEETESAPEYRKIMKYSVHQFRSNLD